MVCAEAGATLLINSVYSELCAHYGVVVIPARPLEPRDKAKVENGVLQAQRRILASLRNHPFFSLAEINDAIAEDLTKQKRQEEN